MTADWVVTFTFDADPSMETMDAWETQLEGFFKQKTAYEILA